MVFDDKYNVNLDKKMEVKMNLICDALELFDQTRTGHVPRNKVALILQSAGIFPTNEAMQDILHKLDPDEDAEIAFSEVNKVGEFINKTNL